MRLLFAAGGTGGHVIPALAIARAARSIDGSAEPLFVGTPRGMENDLVPAAGFALETISVKGLKGKGLLEKLRNLAVLPGAFLASWKILSRFSPEAVFGIGGYASGPILLLASLRGMRTAILEPNAVPGFSNRVLSRLVGTVFVAFGEAAGRLPASKCVVTGNPIRPEILALPPPSFDGERRGILVFGGSQGARRINEAVMAALPSLVPDRERLFFVHQTGPHDLERVRAAYRASGVEADVRSFIPDMEEAYRRCEIVIARSGSSVLEIAAAGRPSILVPFPHAADDHQRANAKVLERAGAAVVIEDAAFDGNALAGALEGLLRDRDRLRRMSGAALTLRRADAAERIAGHLCGRREAA